MGMYRIALVRPKYESSLVTPPLGIGYLSSYLKSNGYYVLLIDALKCNYSEADVLRIVKDNNINIVGITCLSPVYSETVKLSLYLKEHEKNIKIIIGGIHPTFLPYQTLSDSKCDYVFCGEGERALKELLDNDFHNGGIRGVYSFKELTSENAAFEKTKEVWELDDLPYPDWEQMPPNEYPAAPHGVFIKGYPIGIISSSRGCPYSCKFCASPNFYNHKIRFRSVENVVNEIELLVNKYHVKEIHFEDDNLTMNREHIVNICELMVKKEIKVHWSCPNGIRADKIDDELVKLMKKSGFYACALGIESVDSQILKNIDKKEEIGTIESAIRVLRKNKIEVCGFFIFGLPGETRETIKETIDFSLNSGLTRSNFNVLSILPGCDLFTELKGEFIPDFSANMCRTPEYIPEGLTKEDLIKAEALATKKFYLRPSILMNCLKYIKISHIKYILRRLKSYHVIP
jgi:radical SAM superfamily enzyme YgiQ (UPF0313 family)